MAISRPPNDALDFTLEEYDPPGSSGADFTNSDVGFTVEEFGGSAIESGQLPNPIDLPMTLSNFPGMEAGTAIFVIGILGIGFMAVWVVRSFLGGVAWSLAVILLILAGIGLIGLEGFWVMIILLAIIIGLATAVRWAL